MSYISIFIEFMCCYSITNDSLSLEVIDLSWQEIVTIQVRQYFANFFILLFVMP